jgi:hypothetical protein
LSGWKSRFLSFEGHLILLKSVLTSLPIYIHSLFKASSDIISTIKSIYNKKIKKIGGGVRILGKCLGLIGDLFVYERSMDSWGVRKLKEYNYALLGK